LGKENKEGPKTVGKNWEFGLKPAFPQEPMAHEPILGKFWNG